MQGDYKTGETLTGDSRHQYKQLLFNNAWSKMKCKRATGRDIEEPRIRGEKQNNLYDIKVI